jgi:hypothetical protein
MTNTTQGRPAARSRATQAHTRTTTGTGHGGQISAPSGAVTS